MNELTRPVPTARNLSKHGTDWDYLDGVTEEEITNAVERDPDSAPIRSSEQMRQSYKPYPPLMKH